MFYSHEILTSREGGVATVWLVATLGPKSILKKVNRKAILDVDVPKTCGIIITPEVPMALRLQSNLLYGVSRVYYQQCEYILSDAQQAQNNMRTLLKAVRTAELDPNAGKARPDQLILQDDPAFIPDVFLPGLDLDLSVLNISTNESSLRSSLVSPYSKHSGISTHKGDTGSMLGLIIPTSDTGGGGDLGGFILPQEHRSSDQRIPRLRGLLEDEDEGFNLDPGFTVDADGNLLITGGSEDPHRQAPLPNLEGLNTGESTTMGETIQGEIMGESERQIEPRGRLDLNPDQQIPVFGDEDIFLPAAEAFPEMVTVPPTSAGPLDSLPLPHPDESSPKDKEAPFRRRPRVPKVLPRDNFTELRNAELSRWHDNYVQNMMSEARLKLLHKRPRISKSNARLFVLEYGIGGAGSKFSGVRLPGPLAIFSGDNLLEALTGVKTTAGGKKRPFEEDVDSDTESRRVRLRESVGDQMGRGDEFVPNDDEVLAALPGEDIEVGRGAAPALEDQSFPWNLSVSATGSRPGSVTRPFGLPSGVGRSGSVVGLGGGVPSSLDRRTSRITSASPLLGRGPQRYSSLELPIPENDDELLGLQEMSALNEAEDLQHYSLAAGVSTQIAAESRWMRATLDKESGNFLDFIKTEIEGRRVPQGEADEESAEPAGSPNAVLFEDLLPPVQHTKIVAAQALHHVLALATKGLISVQQDMAFGPIILRLQV